MIDRPTRKLLLADLMIIVVALAIGIACARGAWLHSIGTRSPFSEPPGGWTPLLVLTRIPYGIRLALPLLVTTTIAIVALRLRQPRPPISQLSGQPGAIAPLVASLAMTVGILGFIIDSYYYQVAMQRDPWLQMFKRGIWNFLYLAISNSARSTGYAVVGAWVTLALNRRRQSKIDWIEFTGRIAGAAWVVIIMMCLTTEVINSFLNVGAL